jgi:hypothetical protein
VKFRVHCRIDPPAFFGLPDPTTTPIPYQHHTKMRFHVDTETGMSWVTVDGLATTTRPDGEGLRFATTMDGVPLEWSDNVAIGTINVADPREAILRTYRAIRLLLQVFLVKREQAHTGLTIYPFAYEVGGQVHRREDEDDFGGKFFIYDIPHTRAAFVDAAEAVRGSVVDETFSRALDYFALGDELLAMREDSEIPAETMELLSLRFLQYWKALTTIIGDQTDPRFQSKYKNIGLPREFFRQTVRRLKELRDNHDVAHVPRRPDGVKLAVADVEACRSAARTAIEHYLRHLRSQ